MLVACESRSFMGDLHMVAVAQLVRVSGCGPGGRGFESHQPPHFLRKYLFKKALCIGLFLLTQVLFCYGRIYRQKHLLD